ncbi:hypothetical protein TNCV_883991 [Trichonephila clavipes]|nr:hypothetical protein TNCV_883991 [Trichonephila clavipes]
MSQIQNTKSRQKNPSGYGHILLAGLSRVRMPLVPLKTCRVAGTNAGRICRTQSPPVDVAWKFGERVPPQVSFRHSTEDQITSFTKNPLVVLWCNINFTLTDSLVENITFILCSYV